LKLLLDFSFWDLFWLCVKVVAASFVVRWAYVSIKSHWFGPDEEDEDEEEEQGEDTEEEEDDDEDEDDVAIFEGERIFHVGAVRSGQTRIVVATDEDEAKRIGARVLETNEGDLVASEVYDHVARAEDR